MVLPSNVLKRNHSFCTCPWNVLLSHFCVRLLFANRAFTVRSPCVQRAFTVHSPFAHRSQFCVYRSACVRVHRSQSVHRSLTVGSVIVHKTFIVRSSFSKRLAFFIRNSNVKGSFLKQWQNKDETCAEWLVKTFSVYQKFHC